MGNSLADGSAREAALDGNRSFIVQAPAGSGKTGLLTQRLLVLLATVRHPEEVMAITFTKKAAGEMKNRVLDALAAAAGQDTPPKDPYLRKSWHLGRQVLQCDQRHGWRIRENPGRLRILTIDALCSAITRQMPVVSGQGGGLAMTDDAEELYRQASRSALAYGEGVDGWRDHTSRLLDHLDNNRAVAVEMLARMLARREQWLGHVIGPPEEIQRQLQASLKAVVSSGIEAVFAQIPEQERGEIAQLTRYAAAMHQEQDNPMAGWWDRPDFPDTEAKSLPAWLGMADLLLTRDGQWRKRFDVKVGFPPVVRGLPATENRRRKAMKTRSAALVARLSGLDALRELLVDLRHLPAAVYSEGQWQILEALLRLLPMLVAHLVLLFRSRGVVDFPQVAMSAESALGDPNRPSDLALKLDYRIQHLLVDEFQDTSRSQFRLLYHLTAGWTGLDGRSLFLVGDPTQSIYRFREAEVGLFLQARQTGIGMVKLEPLSLLVNFRSNKGLVDWVNSTFLRVMPLRESIHTGAVSFQAATPFHDSVPFSPVSVFAVPEGVPGAEAQQVAQLAGEARERGEGVAILVRSRTHLVEILPALRKRGLRYQGVEIESLAGRSVIRDLLNLTRALNHPADRMAWLALLHAPWCGLTLSDLLALSGPDQGISVWDDINDPEKRARLSADGQLRLDRVTQAVTEALAWRRRSNAFPGSGGLRAWVAFTWQSLGGPAILEDPADQMDAQTFFQCLQSFEEAGGLADFAGFCQQVAKLFANPDPEADDKLQVMTIHKAKGLEFDTVILPGLERKPRHEDRTLLAWLEKEDGLVMGSVKRSDQEKDDPIHAYLRSVENRKGSFEAGRLLYVAATRARKRLHLLGRLAPGRSNPPSGSFLSLLWPAVSPFFSPTTSQPAQPVVVDQAEGRRGFQRLATDWQLPTPPPGITGVAEKPALGEEAMVFDWAGETIRMIGVVVHRFLAVMADNQQEAWDEKRVRESHPVFAQHLVRLGIAKGEEGEGAQQVAEALINTLRDPRGQWILDSGHRDAHSEYALTGVVEGQKIRAVLDRTFIDAAGIRWIIDFKTSTHEGGNRERFLDNEQIRYQNQLMRYAALMGKWDSAAIRLGLYLPMVSGWREWPY